MLRTRIIPVLLLRDWGLEKSVRFRGPVYVGSPINAARVFNRHNVDELILLDIAAGGEGRLARPEVVSQIAEESFMPFTVGGGVREVRDIRALLKCGADRVVINTAAVENPRVVREGSLQFGRQCMVVSIDVARQGNGTYEVCTRGGAQRTGLDPVRHAVHMETEGAGELLLTSIDRDGTMEGYDIDLVRRVSDAVSIPVVACGGAGRVTHLAEAVLEGHASAVACGAFFLFYGPRRTVLLSHPDEDTLVAALGRERVRPRDARPDLPDGYL